MDERDIVIKREQHPDLHRRGNTYAQEYVDEDCDGWFDAWCRVCGQVPGSSFPTLEDALAWRCNQVAADL